MPDFVQISALVKDYPSFSLKINRLQIKDQELVGLIGETGSGKTTLLKVLLNQQPIDGGQIKLFGLDHLADELAIKAEVALLLADNYWPEIYRLAELGRLCHRLFPNWDRTAYQAKLCEAGLDSQRQLSHLNRFEKIRLNLAIVSARGCRGLLIDDSLSDLLPNELALIQQELIRLRDDNHMSIIIASRNLTEIEPIFQRLVYLQTGRIIFHKTKDQLADYHIVDQFRPHQEVIKKIDNHNSYQYLVRDPAIQTTTALADILDSIAGRRLR